MALKVNIAIDQGEDYRTQFNIENINFNSADLTGYEAKAQLRKYYTSTKSYEFSTSIDEVNGLVILAISSNISKNIPAGRYVYDCILTSADGIVTRLVEGIVTINPRVTKNV